MDEVEIYPASLEELCRSLNIERSLSQKERDAIDDEDFAGPDHSFPVDTQAHLDAAAHLIGHADDPEAVKRKAISIAKRKGFKLPESWQEEDKTEERATPVDIPQDLAMYAPIVRVDDKDWIVEGQATSEGIDSYGTIFEYESSKKAFQDWLKRGNIREQHDPRKAVGKALAVEFDDVNRAIFVRARISKGARDTWEKILDGTLSGFSIGVPSSSAKVRHVERGKKRVPMYYDHSLGELSVVDSPSSPNCNISVVRADGVVTDLVDDVVEEQPVEPSPPVEEPQTVERAGARISSNTQNNMHSSISHMLQAAAATMQNCDCDRCQAVMRVIDPDSDGDIDLGGYDDPDHDWQALYASPGQAMPDDVARAITGIVERALSPVYSRLQGIAGTFARSNASPIDASSFEPIMQSAITRAVDAVRSEQTSSFDEVRAELSAVRGQVEKIANTPVPGAPVMHASSMPRPAEKQLATDPYQAPARSGSSVYDAIATLSATGQLDSVEKQIAAAGYGLANQRRG